MEKFKESLKINSETMQRLNRKIVLFIITLNIPVAHMDRFFLCLIHKFRQISYYILSN